MTIRARLLLLDASVIITAHELRIWDALLRQADVAVTSIIARTESLFFDSRTGAVPAEIDLPTLIEQGTIPELEVSLADISAVRGLFDEGLNMALHDGEVEAIAALYCGGTEGLVFCTSDKVAIRVLAMLGLSEFGISLEEVLTSIGLGRPLSAEYTKGYFDRYTAAGQTERIQGRGLPYG